MYQQIVIQFKILRFLYHKPIIIEMDFSLQETTSPLETLK